MATFINDEVIKEVKGMLSEHLDEEQEEIDTLYGDEAEDKNKKVTVNLRVNLSCKGESVEAKSTIDYILVPSTPAKKTKKSKKRVIDSKQAKLPGQEPGEKSEEEDS